MGRGLRRKLGIGLLATLVGFSNCSKKIDNLICTGEIDGKRVEISHVNATLSYLLLNSISRETKVSVFGKEGSLEKFFVMLEAANLVMKEEIMLKFTLVKENMYAIPLEAILMNLDRQFILMRILILQESLRL